MGNYNNQSRVDKFAKRRKNTKLLSTMLVVGGIFLVLLIITLPFGGNDTEKTANGPESNHQTTDEEDDEDKEQSESDEEDDDEDDDAKSGDVKKEKIEDPDDDNVSEAYKGDWKPIGTDQEGEHEINVDDGTQDRKEIEEAAGVGAELDEENMVPWWLERGGEQEVIATVSDKDDPETFRVYLKWVDEEGWQPTKVEVLKENDKK